MDSVFTLGGTGGKPHSAQLQSRAECGWHSIVCHQLYGAQSCGLDVWQTYDVLWAMMMENISIKSGLDHRCNQPAPSLSQAKYGPILG